MLERLSQHLQEQPSRPSPIYGQLTLFLVLVTMFAGWFVYDQISVQLDRLTQKPVLAMEQTFESKL
jgi:hypothetical protein